MADAEVWHVNAVAVKEEGWAGRARPQERGGGGGGPAGPHHIS